MGRFSWPDGWRLAVRLAEVLGGKSESSCWRTLAALFSISNLSAFEFLQFSVEMGAFLEELGAKARILRVDVESFGRCHFVSDATQEVRVGDVAFVFLFLGRPATDKPKAERDARDQNDKRQDPHQQAETLGFRGEQNPFAIFGDKKIFDLLRSFSRLQLLADNAAHLLGHFRRRVRNREILADHAAQLLRDGPCLIVDTRRVGRPHRTHDQKIKNDEKQSNEHEIIE